MKQDEEVKVILILPFLYNDFFYKECVINLTTAFQNRPFLRQLLKLIFWQPSVIYDSGPVLA